MIQHMMYGCFSLSIGSKAHAAALPWDLSVPAAGAVLPLQRGDRNCWARVYPLHLELSNEPTASQQPSNNKKQWQQQEEQKTRTRTRTNLNMQICGQKWEESWNNSFRDKQDQKTNEGDRADVGVMDNIRSGASTKHLPQYVTAWYIMNIYSLV